jgi:hypothetical protein
MNELRTDGKCGEMSGALEAATEHAVDGGRICRRKMRRLRQRRRTRREATASASISIQKARK